MYIWNSKICGFVEIDQPEEGIKIYTEEEVNNLLENKAENEILIDVDGEPTLTTI